MKAVLAGAVIFCVSFAVYAINLDDYFLGDDFDLIVSFEGQPPGYFLALLYSNESGDVWKDAGVDPERGRGYLRPVKIWLLKLDRLLWGIDSRGFHWTSTLFFAGNVWLVFLLLNLLLPGREHWAALGAFCVAVHPVYADVVPFLTAREELVAVFFGLWAEIVFLRHRRDAGRSWPFHPLFALSVMTKEASLAFLAIALGYDAVEAVIRRERSRAWLARARFYAPVVALLGVYMGLRWIAFGNFVGGGGDPTSFDSPSAFFAFHARLFESLYRELMFKEWGVGWLLAGVCGLAVAGSVFTFRHRRRLTRDDAVALLFTGPVWYLASTLLVYGVYFSSRHHVVALIGLVLFAISLLDVMSRTARVPRGWQRGGALALAAVAAVAFLPATIARARLYDRASGVVEEVRHRIERETADLPSGSVLRIDNVRQLTQPPFYFGWGLLSALKKPFTASDLANRSLVINRRNLTLTGSKQRIPRRYDLTLDLDPFASPGTSEP